jgi:hypothetical protein
MEKIIEHYNPYIAFGTLLAEDDTVTYKDFIDITDIIGDKSIEQYKGLGLLFCKRLCGLGTNENKIKFKIETNIQEGTKTWLTQYRLVPHNPKYGKSLIINDKLFYSLKSDAEQAAKQYCSENAVDVHIVTTKVIQDADPCTTSILYRPALKQSLSTFLFFD